MTLKQALREKGITRPELARRIHRSERTIYRYVDEGFPIPPEMALLISMSTGITLATIQGNGEKAAV